LTRRNVISLVVGVVLLCVAGLLFARNGRHRSSANPPAPIVCESCGKEFFIKSNDAAPICPYCGALANVRRLYYQCTQCGHLFVAFELDPDKQMVREPGGEWYPKPECPFEATCPKCGGPTQYVSDVRKAKE
jgi:hypothetical protein